MNKIELPYRFPDPADQIFEEAEQFRKLSSTERFMVIADMMAAADAMIRSSPHREQILKQCEEYEEQWRRANRELFKRHGV